MDFRHLQKLLVAHVQGRVRNGEISERALARLTTISQPHIHNILKGVRLLSMDTADLIMDRLHIRLEDLMTAPQADRIIGDFRTVRLLDGWIGREHPYPQNIGREHYPFPSAEVDRLESPVAARLAPDPLRGPIWSDGVVLLDRSAAVRQNPDEAGYFAVDLVGAGAIGMIRRVNGAFYLWARHDGEWQSMRLPDRGARDLIQGRVSLLVRKLCEPR
jgi:hypothetical protein